MDADDCYLQVFEIHTFLSQLHPANNDWANNYFPSILPK